MSDVQVDMFSDTVCQLGEGPSYDPQSGKLFWFDILGKKLLEKRYPDGETIEHALPEMPSAIAVIDADRQIARDRDRPVCPRRENRRAAAAHGDRSGQPGHPLQRFCASILAAPSGSARWARRRKQAPASIYWFFKGEVRKLFPAIRIPNSICFSEDGRIGHYTDADCCGGSIATRRPACPPASRRSSSTIAARRASSTVR